MNTDTPAVDTVIRQARRRTWMAAVAGGLFWWLTLVLGIWLTLCLLDNALHLPAGLRLPLVLAGLFTTGLALWKKILAPILRPLSSERMALLMEKRYAIPENLVINALQFEHQALNPGEQWFADQTLGVSKTAIGRARLSDWWELRRLARWASLALLLMTLWIVYTSLFPRYVSNAWTRLAIPLSDVPPAGATILRLSPASDMVITEGGNLQVQAEISGRHDFQPPEIVWQDNARTVDPAKAGGNRAPMIQAPAGKACYFYAFSNVRRAFSFRVIAGDTYSRNIRVTVMPLPKIRESQFIIQPPAYTGLGTTSMPGPPCSITCLSGTVVQTRLDIAPAVQSASWKSGGTVAVFQPINRRLTATATIRTAGAYEIESLNPVTSLSVALARGDIALVIDKAPEVEFLTDTLNRFVTPGTTLGLDIRAADDYGISNLVITATTEDSEQSGRVMKTWNYLGPPGQRGPIKERLTLALDPAIFLPGAVYYLTAGATDFSPNGKPGKSRSLILRVKTLADLAVPPGDSLETAFAALKRTIAAQEKAKGITENLSLHLDEAISRQSIPSHQKPMSDRQNEARREGSAALEAFKKQEEGRLYAVRLEPLVRNEMNWALTGIAALTNKSPDTLSTAVDAIELRQALILRELINLLGTLADRKPGPSSSKADLAQEQPPAVQPESAGQELQDDLADFARHQKRIIDQSRTLADQGPKDLTEEEQKILGELAREEAKWAAFFEEKLTDFSKLPLQDFADGAIAKELNEVIQEVKLASQSLYDKAVELAVPHEQSGLENAEELMHNLERWIVDKPDKLKWLMEEPLAQADIALAELPSELEDIVGDLIDKEEAMTEDVEDVSSSWLDSIDKVAGWDAMDGPISSMSAKGITGNLLPNQQEIGGRSGEGRTGRSHGQMVEETASGKGGRNTPSRLTPSPFEQGSIKDTSREEPGGATGGGKLSGAAGEGLRGPTPPPLLQSMARLAGQQSAIRQEAEAVALKLRQYHLPTGDLESSILEMKHLEAAARQGYGLAIRQSFSRAMDSLQDARKTIRTETGLRREQTRLPEWMRNEIMTGLEDGIPRGYEEMVGAYFRALAELDR
ncbi:MAG: hypothetical protein KKG09_08310 [Verrucomicrobia bacterium]|nr:hypothetical protein [Verrucomicrobiota bacterium]MBU4248418.1 hypothetical protein [Verrucomicrobiota bacterium]MBU4290906.1 hypothetical protein [Verrucomicrobiota bacterium]MBU4497991.1 hypothetical protein [Verrucomicrobiota bacterium]MCG2679084.1 hypothetical protein [Kiritimatiellia bacterium]